MNRIVRGALAGALATVAMSVPIVVARQLGFVGTMPPEQVNRNVARRTPLLPDPSSDAFHVAWPVAHVAYGAGCGVLFSLLRPAVRQSNAGPGLAYGMVVWAAGYAGYLPALDIYPSPDEDTRSRTVTMVLAHAVFGVSLAVLEERLRAKER
jgi:Na+/proline symporter